MTPASTTKPKTRNPSGKKHDGCRDRVDERTGADIPAVIDGLASVQSYVDTGARRERTSGEQFGVGNIRAVHGDAVPRSLYGLIAGPALRFQ